MKTIKAIDLLNKIMNEEEVPTKIKYDNVIWEYVTGVCDYKNGIRYLFEYLLDNEKTTISLNKEVEIIEEDKKIEKLEPVRGSKLSDLIARDIVLRNTSLIELCKYLNKTTNKINELIGVVNELKEKK